VLDGQLIFSKARVGRFPVDGEVEDLFAALKPSVKAPLGEAPASHPSKEQSSEGGAERSGMLRRLTDKLRK
jgi:hypothetical protein